jgi:hypothetical protein
MLRVWPYRDRQWSSVPKRLRRRWRDRHRSRRVLSIGGRRGCRWREVRRKVFLVLLLLLMMRRLHRSVLHHQRFIT